MSERKVLNKYYPPDYDASKIPRVKREKNRQFTIRLMVPFNIRCKTCGEYIYRGKKFNARKEDVIGNTYLGIQVYRFYIKCTKCLAEITFLTDPENQDYAMENGAIRNFESLRLAEKQAEAEEKAKKEAEENNPMQVLENRTRDSRREMDVLETLEDLRERNAANYAGVDPKVLIHAEEEYQKQLLLLEKQEDEEEIKRMFAKPAKLTGSEEIVEEVIVTKKAESNTKKKNNSDFSDDPVLKKIKLEAVENEDEGKKCNEPVLFKKPTSVQAPLQTNTHLKLKNNAASFIKKKTVEVKTEKTEDDSNTKSIGTTISTKPTTSLLSMMSSYGSDSSGDSE